MHIPTGDLGGPWLAGQGFGLLSTINGTPTRRYAMHPPGYARILSGTGAGLGSYLGYHGGLSKPAASVEERAHPPMWGDCSSSTGAVGGGQPPHLHLKRPEAGRGRPTRTPSPDLPSAVTAPEPPAFLPTNEASGAERSVGSRASGEGYGGTIKWPPPYPDGRTSTSTKGPVLRHLEA